jgi:hypothetical protein
MSKNEVLSAEGGNLAAERSDIPTIFSSNVYNKFCRKCYETNNYFKLKDY